MANKIKISQCDWWVASIVAIILGICVFKVIQGQNMCGKCQENKVACMNQTSFYKCFDGIPEKSEILSCKKNFDCTKAEIICLPSAGKQASCNVGAECNQCSASKNKLFACTSETTYQMCFGRDTPTGIEANCPDNKICVADNDEICVTPCDTIFPTCYQFNHDEIATTLSETTTTTETVPDETTTTTTTETVPDETTTTTDETTTTTEETTTTTEETTTTTEETTTTTEREITANDICAIKGVLGRFPMTNDTTCKRYASCILKNGEIFGVEHICPEAKYFNANTQTCEAQIPAECSSNV